MKTFNINFKTWIKNILYNLYRMDMKSKGIISLFVLLAIILAIKPSILNDIYNTMLGRLVLIVVIIFLSMNNVTLGLLVALVLIIVLNQFTTFTEGMENISTPNTVGNIPATTNVTNNTVGEENVPQTGAISVLTKDATKKLSELKSQNASGINSIQSTGGVDAVQMSEQVRPKPSTMMPVDKTAMLSNEVSAHTPSMVTNSSSLTEGFCPCAASFK
jgi:hypothetical protein